MEINGIDKLVKSFDKAAKIPDEIPKSVQLHELVTDKFIRKISNYNSLNDLIKQSGFDFKNIEEIDSEKLDTFISKNTNLSSWKDLLDSAFQDKILNQLDDSFR